MAAFGDVHFFVDLDAYIYQAGVVVVVVYFTYGTDGETVGEDGIVFGQAGDVVEDDVVEIAFIEEVDAFEEVDAVEEDDNGADGGQCYFYFFIEFHGAYFLLVCFRASCTLIFCVPLKATMKQSGNLSCMDFFRATISLYDGVVP